MEKLKIKSDVRLSELCLEGMPLKELEVAFSSDDDVYRLYVSRDEVNEIFHFVGLRQLTAFDDWNNSDTRCDILLFGKGIFDGVRHLYLADYMDHVSLDALAKIIDKIREIEVEICSLAD